MPNFIDRFDMSPLIGMCLSQSVHTVSFSEWSLDSNWVRRSANNSKCIVKSHEKYLHAQGLLEMLKIILKRQYCAITCCFHGGYILCSKYMHISVAYLVFPIPVTSEPIQCE